MSLSAAILAVTGAVIAFIAVLPRLVRAGRGTLRAGDRVRLSEGYEIPPPWLGGRAFVDAEVLSFVETSAQRPVAIVKLAAPMSCEGFTSGIAALHLRFEGSRWSSRGVVHVELWRHVPTAVELEGGERMNRRWVESHSLYRRLPRGEGADPQKRAITAALVLFNVALMPLFANMMLMIAPSSAFVRDHNFQLGAVVLACVAGLLRWSLRAGIALNIVVILTAAVMLFWSTEPLAYLAFTGGLLVACALLYGLCVAAS